MGLTIVSHTEEVNHVEMFDGADALTWVVSDVKTKLRLQRRRLEDRGFVDGKAVVRASEFWSFLLKRLRPELTIVSRELIVATIASLLEKRDDEWLHGPGAAQTVFEYIRQLLPILVASSETAVRGSGFFLSEWFDGPDQASAQHRWQAWSDVALDVWRELESRKLVANVWAVGLLAGSEEARRRITAVLPRDLVVDLGAQLSQVEADLFLEIARTRAVTVFRPSPIWESDYPDSRLAVDWMSKIAAARGISVEVKPVSESTHQRPTDARRYLRFPAASAEVKHAVATARQWLDSGIAAERIAIVAPDLEAYWPVLSVHLESEGIATGKSVVTALHSLPEIMRWLARLRSRVSFPHMRDIELDVFAESAPPLSFVEFKELFSAIYDANDLELAPSLIEFYRVHAGDRGRWTDDVLSRDEFLLRSALLLRPAEGVQARSGQSGLGLALFKGILEECPPDLSFKVSRWVQYVGELAAKTEVVIIPGDPLGVQCMNLGALDGAEISHAVVIGLHEGALRSAPGTLIQTKDLRSLERASGWALDGEDRRRTEFEARWILDQSRVETVLTFADTDSVGAVQTPSWTWLACAWTAMGEVPEQSVPLKTRLDLLASRPLAEIGAAETRARLARESGLEPQGNFARGLIATVSPSAVDSVLKCPLRFAFEAILGPRTQGDLELDPAALKQGRLQHALLEELGRRQFPDLSGSEIEDIVEGARRKAEADDGRPIVRTEQAWLLWRRRLVQLGQSVISIEREYRKQFEELRTVAVELPVRGVIDPESGGWTDGIGIPFSGRVDRVDAVPDGRFILIDYKNRVREATWSAWKKNHSWQPILYAMALEAGLGDTAHWLKDVRTKKPLRLGAAFLFDLTTKERGGGLRVLDHAAGIFSNESMSQSGQPRDRAELDEIFAEARLRIRDAIDVFREGRFEPEPYKTTYCESCAWVLACRKPAVDLADGVDGAGEGGE